MPDNQDTDSRNLGYIPTLPERTLRALAVCFGGLVHETVEVLLPRRLRRLRLYQATIGGLLRIMIEFLGGLIGIIPPDDMSSQDFAMRKAAGTGVELAGFMAIGLSPHLVVRRRGGYHCRHAHLSGCAGLRA